MQQGANSTQNGGFKTTQTVQIEVDWHLMQFVLHYLLICRILAAEL